MIDIEQSDFVMAAIQSQTDPQEWTIPLTSMEHDILSACAKAQGLSLESLVREALADGIARLRAELAAAEPRQRLH